MTTEEQILECEKLLLIAIKNSDTTTLEKLMHDDLVFNIPTGQTITKEMDLQNYSFGVMKIINIEASDYLIKTIENDAIVTVTIDLEATYAEQKIKGVFRYLRIWKNTNSTWKIIAGSGIQMSKGY